MRSNLPSPRSPTRFWGYISRWGWWTYCRKARHRRQVLSCSGSPISSPSTRRIRLSLTCSLSGHRPPQSKVEVVRTIFTSPSVWRFISLFIYFSHSHKIIFLPTYHFPAGLFPWIPTSSGVSQYEPVQTNESNPESPGRFYRKDCCP